METKKKVTDLSYLKQLSKGDNGFIREMISVFIEQTPESIRNLETNLDNKNWVMLRAVAHKMKPSFSFVGLQELIDVIKKIEDYAETETNLGELPLLIKRVKEVCGEAISELNEDIEIYK